jgi:hypothetical protein
VWLSLFLPVCPISHTSVYYCAHPRRLAQRVLGAASCSTLVRSSCRWAAAVPLSWEVVDGAWPHGRFGCSLRLAGWVASLEKFLILALGGACDGDASVCHLPCWRRHHGVVLLFLLQFWFWRETSEHRDRAMNVLFASFSSLGPSSRSRLYLWEHEGWLVAHVVVQGRYDDDASSKVWVMTRA